MYSLNDRKNSFHRENISSEALRLFEWGVIQRKNGIQRFDLNVKWEKVIARAEVAKSLNLQSKKIPPRKE